MGHTHTHTHTHEEQSIHVSFEKEREAEGERERVEHKSGTPRGREWDNDREPDSRRERRAKTIRGRADADQTKLKHNRAMKRAGNRRSRQGKEKEGGHFPVAPPQRKGLQHSRHYEAGLKRCGYGADTLFSVQAGMSLTEDSVVQQP